MKLSPKRQRLYLAVFSLICLVAAAFIILSAFRDNIVFFFSPTEVAEKKPQPGVVFRMGGLVKTGSVSRSGGSVSFILTDQKEEIPVRYKGILPDLFREGQGVVAMGRLEGGAFIASEILAKHDENYMPPEVAEALKKSGHFHGRKK